MSQNITLAGNNYTIPDLGEINWGQNLTDYFVAIPTGVLQTTGGAFSLSAEVDFGASYGLKSLYYKSRTTNPAAAGQVRLANTDTISFRNAGNTADLTLGVNGSNQLTFNGVVLESDTLPSGEMFVGDSGNSSTPRTITGAWSMSNLGVAIINNDYITNVMVNSAAAIAYSKLNLSNSIVNGDVNAAAAIAYSKLNLALSIVNADVSASAAIAYSKLNLATSIVNADIAAGAAIAWSKMANLTVGNMLYSDSNGDVAVSGWTFTATGGGILQTGVNGEIRFQDSAGGDYVGIVAPASVTTHTYALPIAAGSAGQVLSWQSGGQLQWINAAGGGTINSGLAGFFTYYPASGTTVDDQAILSTDGTNISIASGQLLLPSGVAASPSYSFTGDLDSGIYRVASDDIAISIGGAIAFEFQATQVVTTKNFIPNLDATLSCGSATNKWTAVYSGQYYANDGTVSNPSFTFTSDTNTGFYRGGADFVTIALGGSNGMSFAGIGAGSAFLPGINDTYALGSISLGWTRLFMMAGTAALPSYTFRDDSNTGLYSIGADQIGFSVGGGNGGTIGIFGGTTQFQGRDGSATAPYWSFVNDPDTGMYSGGANSLNFSVAGTLAWNINSIGNLQGFLTDSKVYAASGSVGTPSYSFISDSNNGMYLFGTDSIAFSTSSTLAMVITSSQRVQFVDGSAALPAISFNSDTDTGIYLLTANALSLVTGGVSRLNISTGSVYTSLPIQPIDGAVGTPTYSFDLDTDTGLYRGGTNNVSVASGGARSAYFTAAGCGLQGTTSNDDAPTGYVGQYTNSTVGATAIATSSVYFTITSISLTAGDWDISCQANFARNGATFTSTSFETGIGTADGNNSAGLVTGNNATIFSGIAPTTFNHYSVGIASYRISIASTTTYYLKGYCSVFTSGSPQSYGRISARRVR